MRTRLRNARIVDGTRGLVVVNRDPLQDIAVPQGRSRRSVMQGGRRVTRNLS